MEPDTAASIVTNRIELEVALARAEATRIELEAALARGRARLVDSVTSAAAKDAQGDEANAKVLRARANCRELHAALLALNRAEAERRPIRPIDILGKHFDDLPKAKAAASVPSQHSSGQAVRLEYARWNDVPGRRKRASWSARTFATKKLGPRAQMLIRQTIGLMALSIAYLQYYYFDVELEISRLHSIVILVFH